MRDTRLDDVFDGDKVISEVLDRSTVMTLHGMLRRGTISGVNGQVGAGKESVVFWGGSPGGDVAIKVYLVSTSSFKRRAIYVDGDPRFSRMRRGTRNMVYQWAQKEFRNLSRCAAAGIPSPAPVGVSRNVLVMGFMGEGGRPHPTLRESEVGEADYLESLRLLRRLHGAGLVHGDYSEYNIFKAGEGLAVFDMGSAVDLRHPGAEALLQRDINNITRFFAKRGVDVKDAGGVLGGILG
ncbi:MAG: serine protein kinase RIO [Nitrosopumilus sp.]|nr:serine protein kinase RIO [Nitrosopumilus sp.]CAI9832117.1 RIO-type serine/threonine-protein kinase Rio1 [Nitrosopumilaceae archaeon]MDA7945079.1 serine protein kinase RIO [Nitrosopumilus sp.]MDA7952691.1 serine protein kinase RIO [Nitrosopumilus sp.]MDA7954454.1 serine protein kinase RIO [Nitrosopumilus sp.]